MATDGDQVCHQLPSPCEISGSAASPSEKLTITLPLTIGDPQSSTTKVSSVMGQGANSLNPVPGSMNTIGSCVGWHGMMACRGANLSCATSVAVVATTSSSPGTRTGTNESVKQRRNRINSTAKSG